MLFILFFILGLLAVIIEIMMLSAWIGAKIRYRNEIDQHYNPKTCVIVPCKFIEKNFEENIKAICNQENIDYKVLFIVDSKKDPVYNILKKVTKNISVANLEIGEYIPGSSGKISALINGIKKSGDVDVLVFADSDIKPHTKWLYYLVSNLNDEKIGATTGYRWYFPKDLKSLFISTWNMAGSLSLYYRTLNFCWGGSTAVKKELFEKLDIENKWKKGFSDDLILTNALRKNKLNIKFIPQSVSKSETDAKTMQLIKWGTRQLTWVKWYYTPAWILSIIGMLGLKIVTIVGFIILFFGYLIPGVLMISTIFFEMISGAVAYTVYRENMNYPQEKFGSIIGYILMTPFVFFIIAYNNLCSAFTYKIPWGGRTYTKEDVVK